MTQQQLDRIDIDARDRDRGDPRTSQRDDICEKDFEHCDGRPDFVCDDCGRTACESCSTEFGTERVCWDCWDRKIERLNRQFGGKKQEKEAA